MLKTSGKPDGGLVWHLPELTTEERIQQIGQGDVQILRPIRAGEYTTLTFQFALGDVSLAAGGRLRIAWRWPFDWGDLQTADPTGDGYLTATVSPRSGAAVPATLGVTYDRRGDLDPWMHLVDLRVQSGELGAGDRIQVTCGDQSGGSRGWRAPTCRATAAYFLMLANPDPAIDGGKRWLRLADPQAFPVHSGAPERLVAVAPSGGQVGEVLRVIVRAEDRWGNATSLGDHLPQVVPPSGVTVVALTPRENPAAYHLDVRFDQPGTFRLPVAVPHMGLAASTNPIVVDTKAEEYSLFWGDLHSGQTFLGCGLGTLAEHYVYARDVAGLQFATHQANDHYMTRADWQITREAAIAFDDPERFTVFLGCEWSPFTPQGGDRNVIYRYDEARLQRSDRFFAETDPDPEPDLTAAPEFLAAMSDKIARGEDVMINMHVGGRPTNLDYHAPAVEPLAEIHSTHGTSEWFVEDALRRGYRIGITAGTDGVMGRPGADHPGWRLCRNVRNGITAVYARSLAKDDLWAAFQARRCYGTTGERIRLWVEADGHAMGAAYATDAGPELRIAVEGTAAIERVDLLRGREVVQTWQIAAPDDEWLRVLWTGSRSMGTAAAQSLVWDGRLELTAGRILVVDPVGLHSPLDGVESVSDREIVWRSTTAGNASGFRFRYAGGVGTAKAIAKFASEPASFEFEPDQIAAIPLQIDAGPPNRRVDVGPARRLDGPTTVELRYQDAEPLAGEHPYWVRVVQTDQARAWSSPIYVTVG